MDLQIIKIVGRSELPGRPWLFGTTQKFLEYFGLKNVNDLPGVEELRRMEAEQQALRATKAAAELQIATCGRERTMVSGIPTSPRIEPSRTSSLPRTIWK